MWTKDLASVYGVQSLPGPDKSTADDDISCTFVGDMSDKCNFPFSPFEVCTLLIKVCILSVRPVSSSVDG